MFSLNKESWVLSKIYFRSKSFGSAQVSSSKPLELSSLHCQRAEDMSCRFGPVATMEEVTQGMQKGMVMSPLLLGTAEGRGLNLF